jgi:hypothetical protein
MSREMELAAFSSHIARRSCARFFRTGMFTALQALQQLQKDLRSRPVSELTAFIGKQKKTHQSRYGPLCKISAHGTHRSKSPHKRFNAFAFAGSALHCILMRQSLSESLSPLPRCDNDNFLK